MDDWTLRAACRDEPPRTFFPESGVNPEAALAICETCQVRRDCLQFALTTNQLDGIWGGMTAAERRRQKSYRIVYCNQCARRFSWKPSETFNRAPHFCSAICRRASRAASKAACVERRKRPA